MVAKKAVVIGLLVICGALAFFVIFGDTAMSLGATSEKALTHSPGEIGNLVVEEMSEWLGVDIPKEILAELQQIIEELLGKDGLLFASSDKQIPINLCIQHPTYCIYLLFNPCNALIGINEVGDDNNRQCEPPSPGITSERLVELAELLNENLEEGNYSSKLPETPYWYAYFAGVKLNDDYIKDTSYIEVSYNENVGDVNGEILFGAYDLGVDPSTPVIKTIPIIWWTFLSDWNKPQREYFSCYVNFSITDEDGNVDKAPSENDWWKLSLLGIYWLLHPWEIQQNARRTFINERFCENWFCSACGENDVIYNECVNGCRNRLFLYLEPGKGEDKAEVWDGKWHESPLLTMATHFRWWQGNKWFVDKSPEYFDDITLKVKENVQVRIRTLNVVLNGVTILSCDFSQWPEQQPSPPCDMIVPPIITLGQDVKLVDAIKEYRTSQVRNLLNDPNNMTTLLEEVAKNLGQTWASKYAEDWGRSWGGTPWGGWWEAWHPTPNRWCSEFACYMIKWHGIDSWEGRDCEPIDVKDMWAKFRYTDEDGDGCPDRISPITEQIEDPLNPGHYIFYEDPNCAETWSELADLVKPGYYGAWYDEDKGEKHMHSFFFVEWAPLQQNEDPDCIARFRFVGGNHDGNKITIGGTKLLYNGEDGYDCDVPDESNKTEMIWGHNYNFFGIVGDK